MIRRWHCKIDPIINCSNSIQPITFVQLLQLLIPQFKGLFQSAILDGPDLARCINYLGTFETTRCQIVTIFVLIILTNTRNKPGKLVSLKPVQLVGLFSPDRELECLRGSFQSAIVGLAIVTSIQYPPLPVVVTLIPHF